MPTTKTNPMGMIVHKTDCIVFGSQDQKIRKQNGLHNSLVKKNEIYYFLKKGTFVSCI